MPSYWQKKFKFASWTMNGNLLSGVGGRESLGTTIQAGKTEYSEVSLQAHKEMFEMQQTVQYYWSTGCHREGDTEK